MQWPRSQLGATPEDDRGCPPWGPSCPASSKTAERDHVTLPAPRNPCRAVHSAHPSSGPASAWHAVPRIKLFPDSPIYPFSRPFLAAFSDQRLQTPSMDSKKPLADPAFMYLADDDWSADKSLSYRQLVEQAQTGMFIVQDEMLTYANPKLLEMVGYTKDKLVNVRKASAIVHPKDRARFEDQVRQRFAGVAGVPYEVQCERADGSTFEARVYGRLVTYDGRVADLITLADVTELTQATEKLKRSYLTS